VTYNPESINDTLKGLKSGNKRAFSIVFDHYSSQVFHFALHFVRSEYDAEEITQEVFVKLWETKERINPNQNFSAYLFTITRNIVFNRHKKKVHEWNYLDYLTAFVRNNSSDTDKVVLYDELQTLLNEHISSMPERRRNVFIMSRFKGLSHKEIADQLGLSVKTVEVHIRLALKELKSKLDNDYQFVLVFSFLSKY